MDGLVKLVLTVVTVSAPAVHAPGPLFVATVSRGIRGGARAGALISAGHLSVELPLVLLLSLGLLSAAAVPAVRLIVGVAGSASLIAFGSLQLLGSIRGGSEELRGGGELGEAGSYAVGAALSGLNPFFVVWWLTIGAKLIFDALELWGLRGVLLMYASHVWMDFAWLTLVAHASHVTGRALSLRWLRAISAALAVGLIALGFSMLASVLD